MNGSSRNAPGYVLNLGCLGIAAALVLLCMMPFLLVDLMTTAMRNLHLPAPVATLAVLGIFLGGLFNLPVYRIQRDEVQPVLQRAMFGTWGSQPAYVRTRRETIIAVNVGGCVIPSLLAVWQLLQILAAGGNVLFAATLVTAANVAICYHVARPLPGVGIVMPGFTSPLVAVGLTWLLLGFHSHAYAAPVAFLAGVAGPLVGADLLHLKDISRMSTGLLSIGGAGTFDGIVLSGVLAALLA